MIRLKILALVAGQLLLGALLVAVAAHGGARFGPSWQVAALAVAFAVVGLVPMHLELGRSTCTVTLSEAVLVVGLFTVNPLGVVVAATAGQVVAYLALRLSPLKLVYSTVAWATGTLASALVFVGLGGAHLHAASPRAWLVTAGAVGAFASYTYGATYLAQSVVEGRRLVEVARASAAVGFLSSVLSASLGLVTLVLFGLNPAAPFLLAPLLVIAALETRWAAGHRAEHLRFKRLYAASGRTTGLNTLEQALTRSASEARNLVTGVAAACCASDRKGNWVGVLVDDNGSRPAGPATTAAIVDLVGRNAPGELDVALIDPASRRAFPSCAAVVVAGDRRGDEPIALAVFRELATDNQGQARAEVLGAFVGHAALIAANAVLYEGVQHALAHQVDLNRQKDEFTAAMSHELRTPLTAMITSIATLRRLGGKLDQQATGQVLEMADRQGQRLRRLIDDLLMLAAIEQSSHLMPAEPTDVASVVSEVADELIRLAPNDITIDISAQIGTIESSPARLRQIVTNLVENAVKYAGGSAIEVTGRRQGQMVALAVVDHGPGIAVDDTARVFERFVQLDQSATRTKGGTGLGLHLCLRIAELLGGWLSLTTTPGGGATFTLSFPAPRLAAHVPQHRQTDTDVPALVLSAQKGS